MQIFLLLLRYEEEAEQKYSREHEQGELGIDCDSHQDELESSWSHSWSQVGHK